LSSLVTVAVPTSRAEGIGDCFAGLVDHEVRHVLGTVQPLTWQPLQLGYGSIEYLMLPL